jgi:hypothetical protein
MGVFNTLHATVACPTCGQDAKRDIQFKYGDSGMNQFVLGESIGWDVNVRGRPWAGVTLTSGIAAGPCAGCATDLLDFVIELHGDKLVAVWPRSEADEPYWPDLDRNYAIHFGEMLLSERAGRRASLTSNPWTTDDFHD